MPSKMRFLSLILVIHFLAADDKSRARDLGVPFEGEPGRLNAITDVAGVKVGHSTIIRGEGKLKVGRGPVRTGVTAVLPRGDESHADPVFAGWYSLNGNGEMTGTTWVEESGFLEGPVMITNTHSVGVVRDAVISWRVARGGADASGYWWSLPVVAETYDGFLNDINGFHVKERHAHDALKSASGGPVAEGGVGGGTGMVMLAEPILRAMGRVKEIYDGEGQLRVVFPSPQAPVLTQETSRDLAESEGVVFICGHYKGIDERVRESVVTDEISIGDYVVTGGELPSMVILDSVVRLIPGVLGDEESARTDSFTHELLDHPHYTRPEEVEGMKVPEVLMSGHHAKIDAWRQEQRETRTRKNRPDLWERYQEELLK